MASIREQSLLKNDIYFHGRVLSSTTNNLLFMLYFKTPQPARPRRILLTAGTYIYIYIYYSRSTRQNCDYRSSKTKLNSLCTVRLYIQTVLYYQNHYESISIIGCGYFSRVATTLFSARSGAAILFESGHYSKLVSNR